MDGMIKFSMLVKNIDQYKYYRDLLDRSGNSGVIIRVADMNYHHPLPMLHTQSKKYEGEESVLTFLIDNNIIQGVM